MTNTSIYNQSGLDDANLRDVVKMLLRGYSCDDTAKECHLEVEKVEWVYKKYLGL